jgi:hypothetical protein
VRVAPHGQTDGQTKRRIYMMKLIVAFRNFANAPRNKSSFTPDNTLISWYLDLFYIPRTTRTFVQYIYFFHSSRSKMYYRKYSNPKRCFLWFIYLFNAALCATYATPVLHTLPISVLCMFVNVLVVKGY